MTERFAKIVLRSGTTAGQLADLAVAPPDDQDFRLLAEHLPTLCWIARGDGSVVWHNRRWHDYCGTTPGDMEGWGWQSVHDPVMLPELMSNWTASIAEGRAFEMFVTLRGADAIFRPFLARVSPLHDAAGTIVRWFGVNEEIGAQQAMEAALIDSQRMYATLTNAMPQMVWSTLPDGAHDFYNDRWYDFTGVPRGSTDGAGWSTVFHPDDQKRAWERWSQSLATGEAYEIDYRLRHHTGAYRWTLGRAVPVRDAKGKITRWIGTCTDIHDERMAAERSELLSQELSHRIKNIFSIVTGLIGLSARRDPALRPFARTLSERVAALGRAHDFARPHSEKSRPVVDSVALKGLLGKLFEPYSIDGNVRVRLLGDDPDVDDKGATPLALLYHELATNAAKYGALSVPDGHVDIHVQQADQTLRIVWDETGGPPVEGPPPREGFGSQLVALSVEKQLDGRVVREWRREGLRVTVELAAANLVRR